MPTLKNLSTFKFNNDWSTSDDIECGGPAIGVNEDPAQREGHHVADHRAEEAPGDEAVESELS